MKQNDSCFRTIIGGQALIEGILMRGPDKSSIVVRKEDGSLVEKTEPLNNTKRSPILKWPFIRGVYSFGSSMAMGIRALFYSADTAFEAADAEPPSKLEKKARHRALQQPPDGDLRRFRRLQDSCPARSYNRRQLRKSRSWA